MRWLVILALVMDVSAASAADTSLASPTGDVYEVEFRFRPDLIAAGEDEDPDGIAALMPAKLASGEIGFLVWGPVWDFDHAAGTANMQKPSPQRWHAAQGSMYCEWLSDYRFARRARAKYLQVRDAYAALAAEGGAIDDYAAYLRESAEANDARWPQNRSFAQDVDILKEFIAGHRDWLDEQFATVPTLLNSVRCDAQTNPWDGIVIPEPTTVSIR